MGQRPKIKKDMKEKLVQEAGMKCANPGCSNYRVHIHHIQEWAIYKTHDERHMIAICPTCHDEVHFGKLKIDDATIYQWKNIKRTKNNRDQLFIEPDLDSKLLLGSIAFTGPSGLIVFELSNNSKLGFKLIDDDIFLVNLSILDLKNKEVLKIAENHVKYSLNDKIQYERRPGRIRVTTSNTLNFVPLWSLPQMLSMNFTLDKGILTLLDIEVLRPGLVKVEGFWAESNTVVIITDEKLAFIKPHMKNPLSLVGEGENSVIQYTGKVTTGLFGL